MYTNKLLTGLSIIAMLTLSLGACKKQATATKSLTGGWLKAGTTDQFYIVTSDQKWYEANNDYSGFKTINAYNYQYTGSQLQLQGASDLRLYNTRFSGDTFILNGGNTDYLKLVPTNTGPQTVSAWVHIPTVLSSFADTAGVTALTVNAGHLYGLKTYSSGSADTKLFDFDPVQQRIVHEIVTDQQYTGLDFLNGTLWASSSNKLYTLNPTTGINAYASPPNTSFNIYGLAAKSDAIYTYTYSKIQIFDPNSLTWNASGHDFIDYVDDLAYADGFLAFTHKGLLYQSHPYYLLPGETWYVEGYSINCIAYDGTYYWASAKNLSTKKFEILKLQLD